MQNIIIMILIFFFTSCSSYKKASIFKVHPSINFNGEILEASYFLINDEIIVEPIFIKIRHYEQKLNSSQTSSEREFLNEKDSLIGYYLAEIDGGHIYRFSKEHTYQEEVAVETKTGFKNFDELDEISPFLSEFKINNNVLEYTSADSTKYIVNVSKSLHKEVLLHPISTYLDKKFKGVCTSLTVSNKQGMVNINYNITPVFEAKEYELFNFYNKIFKDLKK